MILFSPQFLAFCVLCDIYTLVHFTRPLLVAQIRLIVEVQWAGLQCDAESLSKHQSNDC